MLSSGEAEIISSELTDSVSYLMLRIADAMVKESDVLDNLVRDCPAPDKMKILAIVLACSAYARMAADHAGMPQELFNETGVVASKISQARCFGKENTR